ncbi:MAG: hypothetical protein ACLUEV_00335 [Alistipes sp.]
MSDDILPEAHQHFGGSLSADAAADETVLAKNTESISAQLSVID